MDLSKERHTEPVLNVVMQDKAARNEFRSRMYGENGLHHQIWTTSKHAIDAHKDVLGRQTYCWTGSYRHWVWDYGTYRVYVSKRGISIEVDPEIAKSVAQTMAILRTYWEKFGV